MAVIMIMIMMVFHAIVFVMQRYLAVMIPEIPKNRYKIFPVIVVFLFRF